MRELGKVAEYKISECKSFALVYTNNSRAEKELASTVPFKIIEKILKCLGINLTKYMENLYEESYKTLKTK